MVDFVTCYKNHGLTLHNCPICRTSAGMKHHWAAGNLFLYCPNGCGSVEVKQSAKVSEEDMVIEAVKRWNLGKWE